MAAEDLVTAAQVTATLGAAIGGRADLALLITAASQAVCEYCKRPGFLRASVDDLVDGTGTATLLLSRPPVGTVTAVAIDGEPVDLALLTVDPAAGLLHTLPAGVWPRGHRNVRVAYTGGFETVPEAVTLATLLTLKHLTDSLAHTGLLKRERLGDYDYELFPATAGDHLVPQAACRLLDANELKRVR